MHGDKSTSDPRRPFYRFQNPLRAKHEGKTSNYVIFAKTTFGEVGHMTG